MIGKTNSGLILGIINVSCPNPSTITVTNGNLSFTRTGTSASFKLPRTGTWTVTVSYNGLSEVRNIAVAPGQVVNVTMMSSLYLYNRGVYAVGFGHGWSTGDQGNHVYVSKGGAGYLGSLSNGSVNLTGYRTVSVYIEGTISSERYASSDLEFEITDTAGNRIMRKTINEGSKNYALTWTFDVSSINYAVRFRPGVQGWSGGGSESGTWAGIRMYSILLTV